MTSQPGYQTIAIHILRITSLDKGRQTTKFGQLIETPETSLPKNHTQNVVEKLFRDGFLKKRN